MPEGGYRIRDQQGIHFITFAVVEWVDVFTRSMYCDIVVEGLRHCVREKGLCLHAWIIMSNHIHMIASAKEGYQLSSILRDFKKYTAIQLLDAIKTNDGESRKDWMMVIFRKAGKSNSRNSYHQFWRQDNKPIEMANNQMMDQRLNYLHNNPVTAGIIEDETSYIYSSARDYAGIHGLIEIEKL